MDLAVTGCADQATPSNSSVPPAQISEESIRLAADETEMLAAVVRFEVDCSAAPTPDGLALSFEVSQKTSTETIKSLEDDKWMMWLDETVTELCAS